MLRFVLFFSVLFINQAYGQLKPVSLEQLRGLQEKNERLVVVFIGTDWCKYCQATKEIIRNDKRVAAELERNFYTVLLNAESQDDITFAGKVFKYNPTGLNTGVHELAEQLGMINGRLSFPSISFLNKRNEIVYQYAGFLDGEALVKLLSTLSAK
jgi:thioredoxin-related protein